MRSLVFVIFLLCSATGLFAQASPSSGDALKQLYHVYDPARGTANWSCSKEQQIRGPHAGWSCSKEQGPVSVYVVLMAQVAEDGLLRTFVITSARPTDQGDFDCHACAPAIGAAVFVWKKDSWVVESSNLAIGFWGGWGDPPRADFVAVGPQKHGFILSWSDEAQGFSSSSKTLVIPQGQSLESVWGIEDESDDLDAYDPDDNSSNLVPFRSYSAFRFFAGQAVTYGKGEYYDIEVISRGSSLANRGRELKPENWTEVYTFRNGKYTLSKRTLFTELSHTRAVRRK